MAVLSLHAGRRKGVRSRQAAGPLLALLGTAVVAAAVLSLDQGATTVRLRDLPALFVAGSGTPDQEIARLVLIDIRLPRIVQGLLTGAALGAAGAVMQGLFRNPLADPGLVGVSSGAALATAMIIVLGDGVLAPFLAPLGPWALPVAGIAGGFAATLLLYAFASLRGTLSIASVLLGGIALSAFAGALTGVLVFMANDRQLRDLTFWTLGSLSGVSWPRLAAELPFLILGALCLGPLAHTLNALLLSESDAFHMGANVERAKRLSLLAVACLVGVTVSTVGVIGFIGVLVPNLARLLVGPDHRLVLPVSALTGALLLLGADMISRTAAAPAEMPVGVVTAVIGAPCFFWLLLRGHREPGS
ncbi:MAG: iron ABC transporter permease [Telmatospirillum sp.]|nr:iron ABC transporter permease [Telmatospirillum sp.]